MKYSNRYSPELRERAVRLVLDPQGGHGDSLKTVSGIPGAIQIIGSLGVGEITILTVGTASRLGTRLSSIHDLTHDVTRLDSS